MLMEWDPKRRQQEAGIMDQRVSLDFSFSLLCKSRELLVGCLSFL